jgi:hypothetical protein
MILTPIPRDRLDEALDGFAAQLTKPAAIAAFTRIRATSPDRADAATADRHQQAALSFARSAGMSLYPEDMVCRFNWDGAALNAVTEAYVILHEVAHFVLAPPQRRQLIDFGVGPGPDTTDRATAEAAAVVNIMEREQDEAEASLLGILWEAALGQPALASFLDQNWLEGLERSAAGHFTAVLARLEARSLVAGGAPVKIAR